MVQVLRILTEAGHDSEYRIPDLASSNELTLVRNGQTHVKHWNTPFRTMFFSRIHKNVIVIRFGKKKSESSLLGAGFLLCWLIPSVYYLTFPSPTSKQ
jgi:hypothetical protein